MTTGEGAPIASKTAVITAGPRGPMLMQVHTHTLNKVFLFKSILY